jgi:tRNA (guanosine-2'-O-)-methyltransferase
MATDNRRQITEFLSSFITEHKKELIETVLAKRTRYVTVVLEDIYQAHNASAVVRTADCFGVQDVHVIEGRNQYDVNPQVLRGAGKWVDIIKYEGEENNTKKCFARLKDAGYRLVGTTPHDYGVPLTNFEAEQPVALVFGTEETGLSAQAMEHIDHYLRIPMYGFTESFNLSVSAAICLYQITTNLYTSNVDWQLSDNEKADIRLAWYKKIVRRSEALVNEYILSSNR